MNLNKCYCCEENETIVFGWISADESIIEVGVCEDCWHSVGPCSYCSRMYTRRKGYGAYCSEQCSNDEVEADLETLDIRGSDRIERIFTPPKLSSYQHLSV